MNTHQNKDRQYCRAIKINKPSDHPGIVVDPDGFDGARIKVDGSGGTHWKNVPRGGYVLERDGVVVGVLSEGDFFHMWDPIPPKPATRTVMEWLGDIASNPGEYMVYARDGLCCQTQVNQRQMPVQTIREFIKEQVSM